MEFPTNGRASGEGGSFKVERTSRNQRQTGDRVRLLGILGLGPIIEACISSGAYVSFGATSDGGAILIRVLDGDEKLTTFCHSRQQLLEALEALKLRYLTAYKACMQETAESAPEAPKSKK